MRGDSHNNSDDDSHDRADGGALRPRVLGSEPAAGGDWLSPLLIALLGAMALGLIFFLSPLMARGRAGWSKQSDSTQPGGAPAGSSDTPFHFEVEESRDDSFVSPFLGDSSAAIRDLGAFEAIGLRAPVVRARQDILRAGLLALDGEAGGSARLFKAALGDLGGLGLPFEEAWATIVMASVLAIESPDVGAAVEGAHEILATLGARPFLAQLLALTRHEFVEVP